MDHQIGEKLPFVLKSYEKEECEIKREKKVLSISDCIISIIAVAPLTISFWRGTWELRIIYEKHLSFWEVYLFGIIVHITFTISQESFHESLNFKNKNWFYKVLKFVLKRFYTYLFACSCVFFWVSTWEAMDYLCSVENTPDGLAVTSTKSFYMVLTYEIVSSLVLMVLRSYRNILSTPFALVMDESHATFYFPLRFRKSIEERTSLYILDCLFSVLVIGTLVVFVWRGAWVLLDIYLFPDDVVWSSWASLIFGYSIVAMAFLLQPIMRWLCDRITGIPRIIAADIFLLFSFVGTVNVWRGIWNLLNIYFMPENRELSSWITHWVCLVLLILLKCSNTLLVRGVYIDAEEHAGKCVVFPIYYLRLIFQHERVKKINKKFQLEAMARRKLEIDSKSGCTCGVEIKNHIVKEIVQNHYPEV